MPSASIAGRAAARTPAATGCDGLEPPVLRKTHVEPFLRERSGAIEVDFLVDPDGRAAALAGRLLALARRLEGRSRATVIEALRRQERRVRDTRRLAGLSKSLLDRCRFRPPEGADRAPEIRAALFDARGEAWPPSPVDRDAPYRVAAGATGLEVKDVERLLYADRPDARVLTWVPPLSGSDLLDRYNLDLARGVLLDATRVVVSAGGGWRDLFRAVKLARLMYRLESAGSGRYRVELTGPAAAYVTRRERYGARFARVVPALARAPGWRLDAEILRDGRPLAYRLDGSAPIASAPPGRAHDSAWERSLAGEFESKLGAERDGWTLHREATPVAIGAELFLPDFTFRHADGREALVEIVGFWTPGYLEEKLRKVAAAGLENLVLVVYRGLAAGDVEERIGEASGGEVLWFVRKPVIGPVMEAVERVARPAQGAAG